MAPNSVRVAWVSCDMEAQEEHVDFLLTWKLEAETTRQVPSRHPDIMLGRPSEPGRRARPR